MRATTQDQTAQRRPRSQDGVRARDSVPFLQPGAGVLQGRPDAVLQGGDVLAEWFGPRGTVDASTGEIKRTRFPRAEESVRQILDKMLDVFEEEGRQANKAFVATWLAGARDYVEQVDSDVALFEAAMRLMAAKGLTIKSPRSMIAVALDLKAKRRPDLRDYETCDICGAISCRHMTEVD